MTIGAPNLPESISLNLTVAAVVTAHEANLYEVLAAGHLGLDDLLAVSSGVSQRLLGEYRLAGLDSRQNRTLVELTRGGKRRLRLRPDR